MSTLIGSNTTESEESRVQAADGSHGPRCANPCFHHFSIYRNCGYKHRALYLNGTAHSSNCSAVDMGVLDSSPAVWTETARLREQTRLPCVSCRSRAKWLSVAVPEGNQCGPMAPHLQYDLWASSSLDRGAMNVSAIGKNHKDVSSRAYPQLSFRPSGDVLLHRQALNLAVNVVQALLIPRLH